MPSAIGTLTLDLDQFSLAVQTGCQQQVLARVEAHRCDNTLMLAGRVGVPQLAVLERATLEQLLVLAENRCVRLQEIPDRILFLIFIAAAIGEHFCLLSQAS